MVKKLTSKNILCGFKFNILANKENSSHQSASERFVFHVCAKQDKKLDKKDRNSKLPYYVVH